MDDDRVRRALQPGELLHVLAELRCASSEVIDRPPALLLTLSDLDQRAAASQTADTGAAGRSLPLTPGGARPAPAVRPGTFS